MTVAATIAKPYKMIACTDFTGRTLTLCPTFWKISDNYKKVPITDDFKWILDIWLDLYTFYFKLYHQVLQVEIWGLSEMTCPNKQMLVKINFTKIAWP